MEVKIEEGRQQATKALSEASARAIEEYQALQKELSASQTVVSELEAKVVRAAASLKAADDLKEAKSAPLPELHTSSILTKTINLPSRAEYLMLCFGSSIGMKL